MQCHTNTNTSIMIFLPNKIYQTKIVIVSFIILNPDISMSCMYIAASLSLPTLDLPPPPPVGSSN